MNRRRTFSPLLLKPGGGGGYPGEGPSTDMPNDPSNINPAAPNNMPSYTEDMSVNVVQPEVEEATQPAETTPPSTPAPETGGSNEGAGE